MEIRSNYKKPPKFDHLFEAIRESQSDLNSVKDKGSPKAAQNESMLLNLKRIDRENNNSMDIKEQPYIDPRSKSVNIKFPSTTKSVIKNDSFARM